MKKPIIAAFFDVDGTIFRGSLLIEHFRYLLKESVLETELTEISLKVLNDYHDQRNYDRYITNVGRYYVQSLQAVDKDKILECTRKLWEDKSERVFRFAKQRLQWHREQGHLIFLISGSPDFIIQQVADKYQVTDYFGSVYHFQDQCFDGNIDGMWGSAAKSKVIHQLQQQYNIDLSNSYAYGDSVGDISMLELCGKSFAINPTKSLFDYIHNQPDLFSQLQIIIERKDLILKCMVGKEGISVEKLEVED